MTHNFSGEYELARKAVTKGKFSGDAEAIVKGLKTLMSEDGFDDARVDALKDFQKAVNLGVSLK